MSELHPRLWDGAHISASVSGVIDLPIDGFTAWFKAVPLEQILPAQGPIAATTHVTPILGNWNDPGARRRVHQADGSSAIEEVLERAANGSFTYIVWGFKQPMGALARYGRGEFAFTAITPTATRVAWTYSFAPTTIFARPFLHLLIRRAFHPFMQAALAKTKAVAESAHPIPSP